MKALLKESTEVLENLSTECIRSKETPWIENTKWMLQSDFLFNQKISLVVVSTYLEVLHILFKNFTPLRAKIAEVILNSSAVENLNLLKESKQKTSLGIYLCLESFYYLKEDIVAHFCLNDGKLKSDEMFFNLFYAMLECRISEVQSIPLRIICSILKSEIELKTEDDDFVVVGGN